jgi:uncharacterized Fe-S radical SAM superfamily protein PflX
MDQYRPEYSVAEEGSGGKYPAIARKPTTQELAAAFSAAHAAGLSRFDER